MKKLLLAAILSIFSVNTFAACATSLTALRELIGDRGFSARWSETTANDGKPLQLTLSNSLFMTFTKGGQAWASGAATICEASGGRFVANIPSVTWGPAAHFLVRGSRSANFNITLRGISSISVSKSGWSGSFSPR